MNRKLCAIVLLAVLIASCGGGGGSNNVASLSKSTMEIILDSKYGAFYDRVHPAIQAKTTKSDFIECQAKNAPDSIPNIDVRVVETNEGTYKTLAGQSIPVTRATVEISAKGDKASFVLVWTKVDKDWKLIDIPDDDSDDTSDDCLEKL
jgi:hypothetical protein